MTLTQCNKKGALVFGGGEGNWSICIPGYALGLKDPFFHPQTTISNIGHLTEAIASQELRRYLLKITEGNPESGRDFPIVADDSLPKGKVILLGNEKSNRQIHRDWIDFKRKGKVKPGPQGYQIKSIRNESQQILLISGFDPVGTLYGVYRFLEILGIRWYAPDESGEVLPEGYQHHLAEISLIEAPAYQIRGFYGGRASSGKGRGADFLQWMTRNRMNLWRVSWQPFWEGIEKSVPLDGLRARGFHLTSGGHIFLDFLNPHQEYPYHHSRFGGSKDKPKDPYSLSPDYQGDRDGNRILTYAEAHPEWFGLNSEGKRDFPRSPLRGYNFCTSNKDAVREFLKNSLNELASKEDYREADSIDFWPQDFGNWCSCDSCKALGNNTDRYLLLVHNVRQEIVKMLKEGYLKKDIHIYFIIYANELEPPSKPLPEDFDYQNISAEFCPIRRCYVHRLDDPECTEFNRRYYELYKKWQDNPFYRGSYRIVEYYNVSVFRDLPIQLYSTMAYDIRFYYRGGARGFTYMHPAPANWGPRALTNSLVARLSWNPQTDDKRIVDEYFQYYYPGVSHFMKSFYTSLERALCNLAAWKYEFAARIAAEESLSFSASNYQGILTIDLEIPYSLKHLSIKPSSHVVNNAPSLAETLEELGNARKSLVEVLSLLGELDVPVRKRILEDEGLFRHAENTFFFYDAVIRLLRYKQGSVEWRKAFPNVAIWADLLEHQPVGAAALGYRFPQGASDPLAGSMLKELFFKWKAIYDRI